jgi:hypothetical protein
MMEMVSGQIIAFFCLRSQISHASRAGGPNFLNDGTMLGGDNMGVEVSSRALLLWLLVGLFFQSTLSMKPAASQASPVIQAAVFQIIIERS